MCGIAGWSLRPGASLAPEALEAMAAAIRHRGPDDHDTWLAPRAGVGLTHNRLAIIDLSAAGRQPMRSESGRVLVFNGEIYNFQALRVELERAGHAFHSRTDSEVVLRGFDAWGPAVLRRLRGMFALALWSPADETILLARDPMGMKPLYYVPLPGGRGLAFASEVKAFLALPGFAPRVNPDALEQYLEMGYTYDAHATSLLGVSKLPPGHTVELRAGQAGEPVAYFEPPLPDPTDDRPLEAREEELHETLSQVVAEHLIADVPVGLLLSGGLDSSLVAALAARQSRLTTLTMGFADSKVDERPFGRQVAEHLGSDHHEVLFEPAELAAGLDEAAACLDDLFGDWGVITTRLVYARARQQGLKVVLVGEGSDELFAGYPVFETPAGPAWLRTLQLYRRYCGRRYGRGVLRFAPLFRRLLARSRGDLFDAIRLFESRHQLPNNYVMKVDKASMSVSAEARCPWLDQRVAEIAYRTPRRFLLAEGTNKHLLRFMARRRGLLPEEIVSRPKYGASIAASWLDEAPGFRAHARGLILERDRWADALDLRDAMERYFDRGERGYPPPRAISIFSNLAWRLLLLELWSRRLGVEVARG
jgi:asparagine synthase (glutamine-hydrolysing)